MRGRTGKRRHVATFQSHNGTTDAHNHPTYSTDTDWSNSVVDWPCELTTVQGGEVLRGRQVSEITTHVLFGEYFGADGVAAQMRCLIDNPSGSAVTYQVVAAYDADGLSDEIRVELKAEQ